ncbi:YsnF/AvaK domain-containing protein [Carnobacterium sp.]|uniref:YsnF/AvaK domain-containing protein n=1 Tax=Carnobacterium sp. TaxID=48221 RepID=UPI00388F3311
MERYVVGSYASPQEAVNAVNKLQEEGYQKEDITLISSTESKNSISNTTDIVGTTNETDIDTVDKENDKNDRSIWKKIKESFSSNDSNEPGSSQSNDDLLDAYQQDIANGNIIVVVKGEPQKISSNKSHSTDRVTPLDPLSMLEADPLAHPEPVLDSVESSDTPVSENEEQHQKSKSETIQLKEEQLDVTTKEVQTGEVRAKKRIVEETKTIQVPVRHEEIVIEQQNLKDGHLDNAVKNKEVVIPVTEEEIEVTKYPVVKEEVSLNKEEVTDKKQVNRTVKKEDVIIDTNGKTQVKKNNE